MLAAIIRWSSQNVLLVLMATIFAVAAGVPVVPVALAGMKEIWLGKRLFVIIGDPIPTAGKTVDEVHRLGEEAVHALLPTYHEPAGRKPLRRWLTGLF